MALAAFRCRPRAGCKPLGHQQSQEDVFSVGDSQAYPSAPPSQGSPERPPPATPRRGGDVDIESRGDAEAASSSAYPQSEPGPHIAFSPKGSSSSVGFGSPTSSPGAGGPRRQGSGRVNFRQGMFAGCKPPSTCRIVRGISGEYQEAGELEAYPQATSPKAASVAATQRGLPAPAVSAPASSFSKPSDGAYALMEDSEEDVVEPEQSPEIKEMKESIQGLKSVLALTLAVSACLTLALGSMAYQELDVEMKARAREYALLGSIPIVALLFTWFHIWLAIQMMFLPLEFFGLWEIDAGMGIGWQGVVPRKSRKMAKTAYSCARPYLEGPRDWLMRVNPKKLVAKNRGELAKVVAGALESVGPKHFPLIHRMMPERTRQNITDSALDLIQETCPELWGQIVNLMCDERIGIDNDGMIVKIFTENKDLLNRFFLSLGEKEFRFIERCGACMGFICGVVQLVAFNSLSPSGRQIFLPVTGFFLGIVTNWLAILMVFKPCHPYPIKVFGVHVCDIQGLFLKRQKDVAALYAKMLCDNFLDFNTILAYLQTQPELWSKLKAAYAAHSTKVLRETLGFMATRVAPLALGQQQYARLEADMELALVQGLAEAEGLHKTSAQYIGKVTDIERKNRDALRLMPPDEFEDLLHPVFKEDEWILILLGGVLGMMVGLGQVYLLSS